MANDLISRDYSVKALREYAERKHAGGETVLANGILKAVCFLEKKENIPTAYDVDGVVEMLEVDKTCRGTLEGYIPKWKAIAIVRKGDVE